MFELRRKEKAIARVQLEDLALHLIFQFPAQTKNKFVSGMRHTARTTVRVALQCKQKRFHPSDKTLTTQTFKYAPRKGDTRSFICLQEDNLLALIL